MWVAATLIDRIMRFVVTEDGRHAVLTLADVDGKEVTLGLPCAQLPNLVDMSARALTDSERVRRRGVIPAEQAEVTWWTLHTDAARESLLLSLTFGKGGSLCFALPHAMAAALSDDLSARLGLRKAEQLGFGTLT